MDRNKETNYPNSCDNCPNNPDSYDVNAMDKISHQKIVIAKRMSWLNAKIEFDDKYINEMGGSDE